MCLKVVLAITYGLIGAIAWTWWSQSIAANSPVQAAFADLGLIGISALNINFIAQKRYVEFGAYALAAAAGTWLTVFCRV